MRPVAVKVIRRGWPDPTFQVASLQEARAVAASIIPPSSVSTISAAGASCSIVMELVDGLSGEPICGGWPDSIPEVVRLEETLSLVAQVADARAMPTAGVYHRDVSPTTFSSSGSTADRPGSPLCGPWSPTSGWPGC